MTSVDPDAFYYLLSHIKDGHIFETFAQDLLCAIIGVEFVPVGGLHDHGIDGLDHTFRQKEEASTIYQTSIEADPPAKIRKTIRTLQKNGIACERLFYVTNQTIEEKDSLIEVIFKDFHVNLAPRDASWLRGNINKSDSTVRIFTEFVEKHTHQFTRPTQELLVADYVNDPRVFVYLRQQVDVYGADQRLDEALVDSLILYALEGTDPDKHMFRSRDEIWKRIQSLTSFDAHLIEGLVDQRLDLLTSKPRRIRHHRTENLYCLPYETRLELEQQNIKDQQLFDIFSERTSVRINEQLAAHELKLSNGGHILRLTFNNIFKRQGLEFADFLLKESTPTTLENELEAIISTTLEMAGVADVNRPAVGLAILATIRDIIYRGSEEEQEFLRRLSRSYLMLFLLKCEPHVASYFDALAENLRVFVCNSLIVPALSEIALPPSNRRHWNLLASASKAGVRLMINSATLEELSNHLLRVRRIFDEEYRGLEDHYSDDRTLRYVPHILIRAYLYQRAKGDSISFDQFLDKIVTPGLRPEFMAEELKHFLAEEFGVDFMENEALGVKLDRSEVERLTGYLLEHKRTEHQARIDAQTILTIYELRKAGNEPTAAGPFGYRTWWLSKDTTTHRAVLRCFKDSPRTSCYLRPDFLLNFITLSATRKQAGRVFDRMFPTLVGITISHHVSEEMCAAVHKSIKDHRDLPSSRVKAKVGTMSTLLMTHQLPAKSKSLRHYLDEALERQ